MTGSHREDVCNTRYFTEPQLSRLLSIAYSTKVPTGTRLFWEGDPADKLYFVESGRVRLTKTSDEGREFIMYMYQHGDLFGQIDPIGESLNGFGAETLEESVIGVIQQKDLEILLWQHGELALEFMRWMGLMHRMTQTKFRDLMMFGKHGALCSLLIRLVNSYGEPAEQGIRIGNKLTNSELADMIGATRESVNRMLSELKQQHAVRYQDNHLIVTDMDVLRQICHCENCPKDICRI